MSRYRSTHPSHYYARGWITEPRIPWDRPTFWERNGELIAGIVGVLVWGFALSVLVIIGFMGEL